MTNAPSTDVKPLWPYALVFLIGFPIGGAVFGYVLFLILDFATGPYSYLGLKISVGIWAGVGTVWGVYGTYTFRQTDKELKRLQSEES